MELDVLELCKDFGCDVTVLHKVEEVNIRYALDVLFDREVRDMCEVFLALEIVELY